MSSLKESETFRTELNKALDFDAVLKQIAGYASFSSSHRAISEALPELERMEAQEELALAREGMEIERLGIVVPFGGITDISREIHAAEKNVTLLPSELNTVSSFLQGVKNVQSAMKLEQIPLLSDLASSLDPVPRLIKEISAKIDLSGSVRDDASPELKKMNRELTETRLNLASAGRSFVKAHSSQLMETITTTISGRLCVLVKAQDKYAFGGMIHGQSQSGLAVYVEPQAFVSMNNKIQEIQMGIEEEKQKICRELSRAVGRNALTILSDLETMTRLDVAMAKGRWAVRYDGCIPVFREKGLRFLHAKHPLIDEKSVVANDYMLNPPVQCLMISGPNMGGKTVTLKTIGLFIALSHAGFPVLAHEAALPWFEDLWFDIGDNQSIQDNLSTFSAHMQKTAAIVRAAGEHSFILLDEAGNGTDPAQGAALATALIEYLVSKGSVLITSTHYNEVKAYGKSHPNILVSSVEFDPVSLKPTYRYIPGISGASYAFAIAENFGMDPAVLERARQLQEENESDLQKQMETLEKQQNQVRKQQERFDALIADAHRLQKEAGQEKEKWQKKRDQLDEEYEDRLKTMLEEKEQEARKVLEEIRGRSDIKLHEQNEYLKELEQLAPQEQIPEEEQEHVFRPGEYARITGLNLHGEILEVKKTKAILLSNGKKTTVSLSSLEPMEKPRTQKSSRREHTDRTFTRFPLELNIIGMRVEEGIQALDSYLDQAVYHHVKQVRIIHGMGTGKLRNAVWQDLKKQGSVKSFNAGGPSEGGLGATIVFLK